MGGRRHLSLPKWGGVSFVASLLYSNRHILTPASLGLLHHSKRAKRHRIRAKSGQNQIFVYLFLSHLGIFGDKKGQNLRYI